MSWLSKIGKKVERAASGVLPHEHSQTKRDREASMQELAETKRAYETQTAELKDAKNVADYDKREQGKRAASAFKRLRSGGSGLNASEMSVSNKLG